MGSGSSHIARPARPFRAPRSGCAGLALAALSALLCTAPSRVEAQPARPPLLVVNLSAVADTAAPGHAIVRASSAAGESVEVLDIRRIAGRCVADIGGMESLAVVHCDLASGVALDVEVVTVGHAVYVDQYETAPGGERVRRGRTRLARIRRGWTVVPRCAETFDHASACITASVSVPAPDSVPTPCRVELVHTTHEGRRAVVTRTEVRTTERVWGDAGRDEGWLREAPRAWTLEAARRDLAGAHEARVARRTVIMLEGEGGGTLSYFFDALGRTERVTWDPQADSSDYAYRYTYECPTG